MKYSVILALLLAASMSLAGEEKKAIMETIPPVKGTISFHSAVNGVLLKCNVDGHSLHATGGTYLDERGDPSSKEGSRVSFREPEGEITLLQAAKISMKEAKRILGDKVMGDSPTWHLDSAERRGEGGDSVYSYYYHFSYIPYAGTEDANKDFRTQQLQVIVLLDGTLLKTVKRNDSEQASAGQPATRSESDSEGSDKLQPESEGRSR